MGRKIKESTDSTFMRKNDRIYFNMKDNKDKNIILVQISMVHFVHFSEQYCK